MKLVYFDARGVIEVSRVMLKIGGVAFEDTRLALVPKEGGGFDYPEFLSQKASGAFALNMDRAPVLHVDGSTIGQSKSIERFVAKRCNLLGSSDTEAAQIDCITEHIRDIKDKYSKVKALPAAEKEEALKKWFDSDLSEWLVKLEKSLPVTTEGFSVGSSVSYADVTIWSFLSDYFDNNVSGTYGSCPNVTAIVASVSSHPAVQKWLAERPVTRVCVLFSCGDDCEL